MTERFTQVGRIALRDPKTGEYIPDVALYVKETDMPEDDGLRATGEKISREMTDK